MNDQEWVKTQMTQTRVVKTCIFCDLYGLESCMSKTWALTWTLTRDLGGFNPKNDKI